MFLEFMYDVVIFGIPSLW